VRLQRGRLRSREGFGTIPSMEAETSLATSPSTAGDTELKGAGEVSDPWAAPATAVAKGSERRADFDVPSSMEEASGKAASLFDEEAPRAESARAATSPIPSEPGRVDLARLAADLERRIIQAETRLSDLAEGRERLERHIAAQTEELRVQRAAIARTQRVLRSLMRPEDLATEPVPRDPGRGGTSGA